MAVYKMLCQHKYRLGDIIPQLGTCTLIEIIEYNSVLFPGNITLCLPFLTFINDIMYWK